MTIMDLFGFGAQEMPVVLLPLFWHMRKEAGAEESACSEMVKLLVEAGANVNTSMQYHWTLLIAAVSLSQTDLAIYLLDHGADVHSATHFGQTALFTACVTGNTELVQILLQRGADINRLSIGFTPLMMAVRSRCIKTVIVLLNEGADVNVCTEKDETALSFAQGKRGAVGKIRAMLLEAGAKESS